MSRMADLDILVQRAHECTDELKKTIEAIQEILGPTESTESTESKLEGRNQNP